MKKVSYLILCVCFTSFSYSQRGVKVFEKSKRLFNYNQYTQYKYYLNNNVHESYPMLSFHWSVLSYISTKTSNVHIWKNGIISNGNNWNILSNVIPPSNKGIKKYKLIKNLDGCVFRIPKYTKTENPEASYAQIFFNIVFYQHWDKGNKFNNVNLSYLPENENKYTCFFDKSIRTDNPSTCPKSSIKTGKKRYHKNGIQYRVDWCGDGVIQNNVKYDNGVYASEECDDGNTRNGDGCDCNCKKE